MKTYTSKLGLGQTSQYIKSMYIRNSEAAGVFRCFVIGGKNDHLGKTIMG
jgi:predicted hotdog family 3-hydroxylacyl-ACP dehydratase